MNQNRKSDADLVADIKSKNEGWNESFEMLMKKYKPSLYSYILGFVRDRDIAEDMLQETFVKFYASLNSYDPKQKLSTWLFRIAHNRCIDYFRKKKEVINNDVLDYDKKATDKDSVIADEVKYVLSRLDYDTRSILLLRDALGFDYAEIAEMLSIPLGTVKSKISRARDRFKTLWDELVVSR